MGRSLLTNQESETDFAMHGLVARLHLTIIVGKTRAVNVLESCEERRHVKFLTTKLCPFVRTSKLTLKRCYS